MENNNAPPSTSKRTLTLSDLPDITIDDILCRLPVRQAGRTSILSRWWRRRWQSIPDLKLLDLTSSQISQILNLHYGSLRVLHCADVWIATVSRHSASTLDTLTVDNVDDNGDRKWYGKWYDVGAIALYFPNLTHLELAHNPRVMDKSRFAGFAHLRTLHIFCFECPGDGDGISKLLATCPLLETLKLDLNCDDIYVALDIVAPNLRVFKISFIFLKSFTITDAPMLQTVSFKNCWNFDDPDDSVDNCNLMNIFGGLSSVEKLKLDSTALMLLWSNHVPERIHISFPHLRKLSLESYFKKIEIIQVIVCILKSSPNLQQLKIQGGIYDDYVNYPALEPVPDFWIALEHVYPFNKLEAVEMTESFCEEWDLDFIKFLLIKAPVLKTLVIGLSSTAIKRKVPVLTKLLEFPRLSSQARILLTRSRLKKKIEVDSNVSVDPALAEQDQSQDIINAMTGLDPSVAFKALHYLIQNPHICHGFLRMPPEQQELAVHFYATLWSSHSA